MDNTSLAALAGGVGAIVGATVASIGGMINTHLARKSDERRQYRELVVKAALTNYETEHAFARAIIQHRPGQELVIYPLDDYLVHMRRLADVVFDEHLSDEQLPAALQRLEATVKLMRDHHDVIRANKKK